MKSKFAIYGAGGFGKEVKGMLSFEGISVAGFIDDFESGLPVVTDQDFDDVLVAIADPRTRFNVIRKWSIKHVPFNPFISEGVRVAPSITISKGCIICPGVRLTVDIIFGNFVIVNLNATIGHDVKIGDYCSIMPSVNISGNVTLGQRVFIGSGATILQGRQIGNDVVIGAGSVVTHDIPDGEVVMGVPARKKSP